MTSLSAKLLFAVLLAALAIGGCELWNWWDRRRISRPRARVCFKCGTLIESGAAPAVRTLCTTCLSGRR
jgi:hypothetical protein